MFNPIHVILTLHSNLILIQLNQGIVFSVKSNGARLEVQLDSFVIFYGDFRSGIDWTDITVPFGNIYTGPRKLIFIALSGEDDGSMIELDNTSMVEFTK